MRINIAASHRFHLLNLAIELRRVGHEVMFYSYLPPWRIRNLGLDQGAFCSLFFIMFPFLILFKITKQSRLSVKYLHKALDAYMSLFMGPCDLYIALGTVYINSFKVAKSKYNAKTIMEWGSNHIKEQMRVLKDVSSKDQSDAYFLKRTLEGYEVCDFISIPSEHVKIGFLKNGVNNGKIIKNVYGVDLKEFYPTIMEKNPYDIITVGGWSYRKGSDLLAAVCKRNNYKLLHVGGIVDLEFPKQNNFCHVDSVNQNELVNFYKKAKIFVLPSREDGFGMVLLQAAACGLPIVCSQNTGGRELKTILNGTEWIVEMQNYTEEALQEAIHMALMLANKQKANRNYAEDLSELVSWKAYGEKYNSFIQSIC
jgi:glycosyltransferase involved in cell wall biosynthesis